MGPDKASLDRLRIDRSAAPAGRGGLWLVLLAVLLAAAGAGAWWVLGRTPVPRVRVAAAREAGAGATEPETVLNASGYVTARRQATVSSKVTGKVAEVLIEEGMRVAEGQVLARLDQSNVRSSLELAEAQEASARAALEETEVLLADARRTLSRMERLIASGVATQADLDSAQAGVDSLAARLRRQREDVAVAASRVAVWRQNLEDTVIRAPFAGIIVDKNAQPGEMISPVSAGGGFTRTGIGTLVDMDSLEIEVDVNESYINRVSEGQRVTARLDAYPDWDIPCRVIAIIPTADRQRATVQVRVGFDELDPRILPDMGVKVAFQEGMAGEAGEDRAADEAAAGLPAPPPGVLVPASAVRRREGRDIVLVVADGVVERRAVATGGVRGDETLVTSGLSRGERVIIDGPADLAEGDRVEVSGR